MPRNATTEWDNVQVLGLRLTGPRRELLEQAMQRRGLPFSKQNATACIEWALAHVTAAGPHAGLGAQHKEGAKMFKPGQQVTLVTATFDSMVEPDKRYTHYSDYDGELTTNQGWSTVILTEAEAVALNLGRGFVRYHD